ncbi:MAG: hypothetical protein WBW32_11730 [Luteibacter sp.]
MQQALAETTLASLGTLAVGDWFLTRRDDTYVVGFMFAKAPNEVSWVEIDAERARCYQLDTNRNRQEVLRISVPEKLQVQFDLSPPTATHVPNRGQLVIIPELGACIAVDWAAKNQDKQYSNLLSLKGCQLESSTDPTFVFERWALGYYGLDGKWIDVVRRGPPLPAL